MSLSSRCNQIGCVTLARHVKCDVCSLLYRNNRNYFYNDSMNNRISVQSLSYVYSANLSTPYGSANASASIFPGESFQASSQCCDELGTHTVCILEVSKLGTILAHVYYAISFVE